MTLKIFAFYNMKKDANGTLYLDSQKSYYYEANNSQTKLLREYAVEKGILSISELYRAKNPTKDMNLLRPSGSQEGLSTTRQHPVHLTSSEKRKLSQVGKHQLDKLQSKNAKTSGPESNEYDSDQATDDNDIELINEEYSPKSNTKHHHQQRKTSHNQGVQTDQKEAKELPTPLKTTRATEQKPRTNSNMTNKKQRKHRN